MMNLSSKAINLHVKNFLSLFLSLFNTRNWTFPFKNMATPSAMDGKIKHHSMSKMLTNIKS